jgi:hypothetical protein
MEGWDGMAETKHTPGPWAWREFGSGIMLVTQHQGSRVVLSASPRGVLQTRDANGTLRQIEADHPNALLLKAAPDMLAALNEIDEMPFSMVNDSESLRHTIKTIQAMARAAIGKAKPA